MTFRGSNSASDRGTVILVALCFVAVMAIVLGSYLAVTTRAMQLSNRGFQAELSKQLAEAGLEEALRAFNKNDWSDWTSNSMTVDWDTTTYAADKRAVATITYPATKFGQGATATVKLRVDNHDAHVLGSAWSAARTYRIGDTVGYSGLWFTCVKDHTNQAPTPNNFTNWVPTQVPWKWDSTRIYKLEELVNYNGTWYRCIVANTAQAPPNSNWQSIPTVYFSPSIDYTNQAILNWYGTWYRYNSGWDTAPAISWRYRTGYTYSFNDLVYYNYIWYRFINGTPTANVTPGSNASYWENALSGTVHGWLASSINYNLGDVVYYSSTGQWYRCLLEHTSSGSITPANTTYWTNTPALSNQWNAGPYYSANDVVTHNGVWYLCILSHTSSASILPTNTNYWIGANTSNAGYQWNSTTAYAANSYRCYGGVWYKCLVANTGESPNNTTYWTAAWAQSSGVTSGAPVVHSEAEVTIGDSTTSRTQLRAPIFPATLFPNAIGTTTTLTINGGTGTVDSYDSSVGTYASQVNTSTNYSAVLAAGTGSATGTSTLLSIGNGTTVKGYVAAPPSSSAPYAPRVSFGSSAVVKSSSSPVSPNADLGQVGRSPYVPAFDLRPVLLSSAFSSWNFQYGRAIPTASSPATYGNTINLGTPGATTPSIYYYNGTLNIGTGSTYYIGTLNIIGPVKLYINGHLNLQAGGLLRITSAGSAEIHVDGRVLTQTTAQGFDNQTLDPKKLFLICDLTGTTVQRLQDNTYDFYGLIYAPNTTATLGLDIRTGVVIYGALSAREITFNAEANVHYDTSLRYATFPGVDQPYTVTDWRELPATEQATMP